MKPFTVILLAVMAACLTGEAVAPHGPIRALLATLAAVMAVAAVVVERRP